MSGALGPNRAIDALGPVFEADAHEAVEGWQLVAGDPTTATRELAAQGGVEVGIWELTAGVAADVEIDEVFVVLSGAGTVEFPDDPDLEPLHVRAGTVARLAAGTRTRWTVEGEPLRKVYIALPEQDEPAGD